MPGKLLVVLVLASAVGCGGRQIPGVVTPTRASPKQPTGQDRGDIEVALGAVTAAVSATLVGLGVYSAWRSVRLRQYCAGGPDLTTIEDTDPLYESVCNSLLEVDPARSAAISAGLSFAFSLPIAVASGLLLRKGVRMRREYKRVHSLSLQPWSPGLRGGGVAIGWSF